MNVVLQECGAGGMMDLLKLPILIEFVEES